MNCFKIFIFTFFFSIIQFIAVGQELGKLFSKYFSPAEYNIGTQNWDIAQDANGILYFGNQHGLCEFDGTKWALYPFPGSTIRTLEITKNGYILAGGINEFGYYAIDKTGKLRYKSLKYLVDSAYRNFGDVWNVEIINDSWFFQTDKYLFRIKANKCKIWNHSGEYFYYSYKLKNQLYIQDLGKGLFKIEGDSLKPLFLEGLFAQKKILCILPYKDNLLVGTRTNGLYLVDLTSGKIISLSDVSIQAKALNQ